MELYCRICPLLIVVMIAACGEPPKKQSNEGNNGNNGTSNNGTSNNGNSNNGNSNNGNSNNGGVDMGMDMVESQDRDGDGLSDMEESVLGTNPDLADSDGDGATDYEESIQGYNPLDGSSNPAADGIISIVIPANQAARVSGLKFQTYLEKLDVYLGFDNSGSMTDELSNIGNALPTIHSEFLCDATQVSCGADAQCGASEVCNMEGRCAQSPKINNACVMSFATGFGVWSDLDSFANLLAIQASPGTTRSAILNHPDGAGYQEAPSQAPACAVDQSQCQNNIACSTNGVGCVGFRPAARRVYMQITDANNQCDGNSRCLGFTPAVVGQVLLNRGVLFAGVIGSGDEDPNGLSSIELANAIGVSSGSVDALGNPLVVSAGDGTAVSGFEAALEKTIQDALHKEVRLEISSAGNTNIEDMIDFVEADTQSSGCPSTTDLADLDGDLVDDAFLSVVPGNEVCFGLGVKAGSMTGAFKGTLTLMGDHTPLDAQPLVLVIPPSF